MILEIIWPGEAFGGAVLGFPARLGAPVAYRLYYYLPLVLLHLSLVMRLAGDFGGWVHLRQWGGLLNALAIILFLAVMLPNLVLRQEDQIRSIGSQSWDARD